ncbi:MAG: glucose-1-phosphate thymidylyltransferase [Saprospirales bacterium]|nr:MAG: glucose-1-phosphate thymidylyltransferase [Saprospirales bacterium]
MKAIIPVAGAGTRLRPLTYTQPKPLIPVAGKPIIGFIIDELIEAGFDEFVFVIGYLGDKIKNYIGEKYPRLKKEFVVQESREGLGHAIWSARNCLKRDEKVFVVLGDLIFDMNLDAMLQCEDNCVAVAKVSDPREFGIVELNKEGFVMSVVEKPSIPKSNLAMIGIYKFQKAGLLIEALDDLIRSEHRTHSEFQLTDAIMRMLKDGGRFHITHAENWYDCGKKDVLLKTNSILLEKAGYPTLQLPGFNNTIILQPVHISPGCEIENSIIGPHVTIGGNSVIRSAIIKESIIGEHSSIEEVVLQDSIVGNDTAIRGMKQSLNLGDNTEIDFSR